MNWSEITIKTETPAVDALCAMLTDHGVKGFSIQDKESFQEFLNDKDGKWDYIEDDLMGLADCDTTVTFYLPDDAQGAEQLNGVRSLCESLRNGENAAFFGSLAMTVGNVSEEDWANNWKQYFKPLNVGEKLLIKPSWEPVPAGNIRTILEIDPASSFGTGQHHTTRLCLELAETVLHDGDRVLDLGCGSGILSIGAILLGAKEAAAVDIVDNSVRTAVENAAKNGIGTDRYTAYCGDIIGDSALRDTLGTGYDLICANIVADVLIAMSGLFRGFLKENGNLIVSGIISERADEVLDVLGEAGFTLVKRQEKEGWCAALLSV
ncbi:MAG: 50S ribosomal protein L11 methyltransferase [Oscillospiraceae bacterium]|nr:50S ribosomal protein L11 methyltransferase [Oscillospiraceae bacterium]